MFKKSNFFKKENVASDFESRNNINSKFTELSLDAVFDESTDSSKTCGLSANNLEVSRGVKEKQMNFVQQLFIKREVITVKSSFNSHKNEKFDLIPLKRKILFPVKTNSNKNILNRSKIFSKYVLPDDTIQLFKWLKHCTNRIYLDIDKLINSACKTEIKKLVPNKFCQGKDIVPNYLLKKSKKLDLSKGNRSTSNKTNSVTKAYKDFKTQPNSEFNLTFLGFSKSGKSTLIGNILIHLDLLDKSFINKTEWEATKMNKPECKIPWLVDISSNERSFNETILSSASCIEINEKFINLIDTPGNIFYHKEIIKGITRADHVLFVINIKLDWCPNKIQFKSNSYIDTIFYLMKVFSIDKLHILFVNVFDSDLKIPFEHITLIWKKISKVPINGNYLTVRDLSNIESSELVSIVDRIKSLEMKIKDEEIDKPLLMEIIDIYKPVESALPIVVGRVLRGGISAGVNKPSSKGVIMPEMTRCTVKSMKIHEKNELKTRSFAFSRDLVELTLVEINSEDKIKNSSLICDPDTLLSTGTDFEVKIKIFHCDIDIPIINGIKVLLWSMSRSCFCEISRLISVEFLRQKQKITKKFPRLISQTNSTVTALIRTEDHLAIELNSVNNLDIFILFSRSILFAAGKFVKIIK